MLLFMVEGAFFLIMEVWSMHNADTQSTVWGGRRPKVREDVLFKFLLPYRKNTGFISQPGIVLSTSLIMIFLIFTTTPSGLVLYSSHFIDERLSESPRF